MKFDAKMARDITDFYNNNLKNSWNTIARIIFWKDIKGEHFYSTSPDKDGKIWSNIICKRKEYLTSLGFTVDIDEDMKTAIINW